jgi:hypothetical protein
MTNNPRKIAAMENLGIPVAERVPLLVNRNLQPALPEHQGRQAGPHDDPAHRDIAPAMANSNVHCT